MSQVAKIEAINILIVEDEAIIAEDLRITLEEIGYRVAGVASSYEEAIKLIDLEKPDFVILDIIIKGPRDGIALGTDIHDKYNIPFIFLTSHADKATVTRAKAAHPSGYLLKPFEQDDLYSAIEIGLSNFSAHREASPEDKIKEHEGSLAINDSLFIRDNQIYIKVPFNDILYIKVDGNYLKICSNDSHHMVRGTLKDALDTLPKKQFIRIFRSHIVNISKIEAIHPATVEVRGEHLPINKEQREQLIPLLKTL